MILSKARRWPLLAGLFCLLLIGFAGASYASVRFDVQGSPTEVINTGRSEVTGSITLFVRGAGVTGTAANGDHQIALLYTNPSMEIDNTVTTGIRLFFSTGFTAAFTGPSRGIVLVQNVDVNGRCSGAITINMAAGASVTDTDFIRIEGVRGRIDASTGITPGVDLFVALQSINDPSAATFTPDIVRVAKSFDGMNVTITPSTLLLCFPTIGTVDGATPSYAIKISEGFARAFVDDDANNDEDLGNDRVDGGGVTGVLERDVNTPGPSEGRHLGAPTNPTMFMVWLEQIPASVSGINWPTEVALDGFTLEEPGNSLLERTGAPIFSSSGGIASAIYSYQSFNQTGVSDITSESFTIVPVIVLKANATATGTITAAVTLAPVAETLGANCAAKQPSANPNAGLNRPRFQQLFESDDIATNNPVDDPHKPYAQVIRCNCYLLFTYATFASGFNTGIAIANTTGDTAPFGSSEAPDQIGKINFYFFDQTAAYVGTTTSAADITAGKSFVDLLSNILPTGVTSFSGYIIAKAEFQFCHGFAFIADESFASVAQGYLANVIPDPAIKGTDGKRTAADSGDHSNIAAGEGLNN